MTASTPISSEPRPCLDSYLLGSWHEAAGTARRQVRSAVSGELLGEVGQLACDARAVRMHALEEGRTALARLSFPERARRLKALALHLQANKEALYALSPLMGATRADAAMDIDGGIATVFSFAGRARRELPDGMLWCDGETERLHADGSFLGQHVRSTRQGVAVQINAFNFPVWGMLEKFAPMFLAGMPVIVKPATDTAWLTVALTRLIVDSALLPEGSLQLACGDIAALLASLDDQDVIALTGSADTAARLRQLPAVTQRGVTLHAEQDSLNATLLGNDIAVDDIEFTQLADEIVTEMTRKAGQKCTAIRRVLVPETHMDVLQAMLLDKLTAIRIGDPADADTDMGPLVSARQLADVQQCCAALDAVAQRITPTQALRDHGSGAWMSPVLFRCDTPFASDTVHQLEAFGPVATLMPYRDTRSACELLNRGRGSLVASLFTRDTAVASEVVQRSAAWHGRLYISNRESLHSASGHGVPLPNLLHGGPGRAGGSAELGGLRALHPYMQQTALQAPATLMRALTATHTASPADLAEVRSAPPAVHPFRRGFEQLQPGESLLTATRTVTLEDIEHFATFTGDTFYAHMDDAAAGANPFFEGRVAHGYLLLAFAAGLFVDPAPGPVLANAGLDRLRFMRPLYPGEAIRVLLTVKQKTPRTEEYGEVRWQVTLLDGDDETVASYELLTMNACTPA